MIGFCLITSAGWAAEKEIPKSGFLQDYTLLTSNDPQKIVDWVYINEKVDYTTYNKIMLDDVVFFASEDADYKGFEAQELVDLSKAFHAAFIMNLRGSMEFTDTPGPGVMRIRMAITNLVPSNSFTGTVTTIVPVGLVVSSVKKAATGSHIGMGGVTFEGELIDSQSGKILGAVVDSKTGKKYKIGKGASKWGHVIDVFNLWGRTFRTRLDKHTGRE
jgi:hypothetical protein